MRRSKHRPSSNGSTLQVRQNYLIVAPMRFSPNWAFPIILATTCCLANFCQAAADVDLYSFGNWRIVQILTNNSYKLIGGSTGKIPGHFYLQCGADNFLAVGVPIFKTSTTEAGEV